MAFGSTKLAQKIVDTREGLSTYDHARALDHALLQGAGFGLAAYLPECRLKPGQPLKLQPAETSRRPILTVRLDQLTSGFSSGHFLVEVTGLRARLGKDTLHRKWNGCKNVANNCGFSGACSHTCRLACCSVAPCVSAHFREATGTLIPPKVRLMSLHNCCGCVLVCTRAKIVKRVRGWALRQRGPTRFATSLRHPEVTLRSSRQNYASPQCEPHALPQL